MASAARVGDVLHQLADLPHDNPTKPKPPRGPAWAEPHSNTNSASPENVFRFTSPSPLP